MKISVNKKTTIKRWVDVTRPCWLVCAMNLIPSLHTNRIIGYPENTLSSSALFTSLLFYESSPTVGCKGCGTCSPTTLEQRLSLRFSVAFVKELYTFWGFEAWFEVGGWGLGVGGMAYLQMLACLSSFSGRKVLPQCSQLERRRGPSGGFSSGMALLVGNTGEVKNTGDRLLLLLLVLLLLLLLLFLVLLFLLTVPVQSFPFLSL